MTWRRGALGAAGIAIAATLLVLALRGVSLRAVGAEIARADLSWFLVSCLLATAAIPIRAVRWRVILAAGRPDVPWLGVWRATAIGYMSNNLLPARGGEVARGFLARSLVGIPVTTALASIVLERAFDGVVVAALLLAALALPGRSAVVPAGVSDAAGMAALAFVVVLGLIWVSTLAGRDPQRRLAALGRSLLPARLASRLEEVAAHVGGGTAVLRKPATALAVAAWTIVLWLDNAASLYMGFQAFHLGPLPPASALLVQGVVALGLVAPSAPGFFGSYEAFTRLALSTYGVPAAQALSFAVGTHVGWFVPVTVLGFWELGRAKLTWSDLRSGAAPAQDAQVRASPSSNVTTGT